MKTTGAVVLWLTSHHPGGCCTLVVVEESLHDCKVLWLYTIKRYINASFIHSFIYSFIIRVGAKLCKAVALQELSLTPLP